MDFLTGSNDPWRICVDKLSGLVDPLTELDGNPPRITLRITYGSRVDILIAGRQKMTRRRIAAEVKKHVQAVGRAAGGGVHRDVFLLFVLPHVSEPGVWNVTLQTADALDLPSWRDLP